MNANHTLLEMVLWLVAAPHVQMVQMLQGTSAAKLKIAMVGSV
jgi:hypothetical protein